MTVPTSHRRPAPRALGGPGARLALMWEHAPVGKALVDLDGSLLDVNPALCELLDRPAGDLCGTRLQELGVPGSEVTDPAWLAGITSSAASSASVDTVLRRRDGALVPVALHLAPRRGDGGGRSLVLQVTDHSAVGRRTDELQAAVDAAEATANRYRALVDHLPGSVVYVWDEDHRLVQSHGRIPGLRRPHGEPVPGQRPADFLPAGMAEVAERWLTDALAGGRSLQLSLGDRAEVTAHIVPVEQPGGRREALLVVRDISALRARQRELATAGSRWRATFVDAPVAMCELDIEGRIKEINPAFAALTGRSAAELHGQPIQAILHPDDVARSRRGVERLRDGGADHLARVERRVLRPDGSVVWTAGRAARVVPDDGSDPFMLVHLVDITSERAQRRAVEEAGARFAALVEHAGDLIAVLDGDLLVRYANRAYEATFEFGRDEAVGTSLAGRIHPADRDRVVAALLELTTQPGAVGTHEVRVAGPGGAWGHLEITVSNHLDDPAVQGMVCNGRDITERVAHHAALAHAATHDPLTGLANRALLRVRLADRLDSSAGGQPPGCAVLYLDLDRFKAVNDAAGHAAGDELLQVVASRLLGTVRAEDTVARPGGDEFVVLVDRVASVEDAEVLAQRIIDVISQPLAVGGATYTVGCSVGIGVPCAGADPDSVLDRADRAMYAAKGAGRARWALGA